MGSQFVDLDADGHLDYLTATFDGTPHVARGTPEGFAEPVRLKDRNGERVVISYLWDYDAEQHVVVDRAFGGGNVPTERCISALAFDWDGDGDHDLLLGSYENGRLYRQMNEGTDAEPAYTGRLVPVMAGNAPFALPSKMTAPVLVDWDGDGDLDLVAGSFGDVYDHAAPGGGVYLARNLGRPGAPRFAALETLVAPGARGAPEPVRPDAGLYPAVVDWDGDGDLDLVVGGYSMWTPPPPALDDAQRARAETLRGEVAAAQEAMREASSARLRAYQEALGDLDPASDEARALWKKVVANWSERMQGPSKEYAALKRELEQLVPSPKRRAFVWLYERLE